MFRRKKRGWLAPDAVSGGAPPAGALCEYFEGGNPMKKFLSLVLALVMTMSLVTVSAGAKEFKDDADVTYDEAVAVISEVGVVDGYEDGSFKPSNTLTRGAAAKIICNLILGPTTAAELRADTAPYKDVPVSNVFSGYIAYCAKEGIISGYADGSFRPAGTLTGYAFMKMLLGALGYDSNYEGYTGGNWSINVAKQAIGIGLNKGMVEEFNGVDFVTREEAALYAFNTLKATMVDYDQKITTNVNGVDVTISQGNAKPVTWTEGINEDGNIKDDGFVQFAEEFFPKLVRKDDSTKFMAPANTWVYDKTEIGTFERTDLIVETYTTEVTGKDAYDLLKAGVIKDNDLEVYVDGKDMKGTGTGKFDKANLVRSNNNKLGSTGDGVVTKVYLDTDNDVITFVSVNTYLAQATADYNETKEYAPLGVYVENSNAITYNVDVEDVANVVDVKEDTFYQVTISWKDDSVRGEVVTVNDVEVLEDSTITKFSTNTDGLVSKVTTGGEEYKRNVKAYYDDDVLDIYNESLLTDKTYNVYVDANGYFIGVSLFEGAKNYVFVTGYDLNHSNLSVKTADAAGIFLDGTMKQIKVNVTDTNANIRKASGDNAAYFTEWNSGAGDYDLNCWYTYIVDADGTYTLKPATRMTKTTYPAGKDQVIRTDNLSLLDSTYSTRVYGEDATVFLTADTGDVNPTSIQKAITEVTGVYTGVQNVEIEVDTAIDSPALAMGQVFTVYDSDNYVIAAVVLGESIGSNQNLAYVLSGAKSEEKKDDTYYWEFEAVMNGEVKTLTAKSKYLKTIETLRTNLNEVVELRFDGDYVVDVKDNVKLYTNTANQIDGEAAYWMPRLTAANNTVNLQGSTMYIQNNKYNDVGLGIAKDAKAVVIQPENNKTVKTEFTSVAAAVAHLADPDNNSANGLQYNGIIVAALNSNGTAAWVVFDSTTNLSTGGNQGGGSQTPVNVPGVSWDDTLQQFKVRYYNPGNKMNDQQVRNYVIEKMEAYAGAPVKSYIGNLMTFADGSLFGTRVTVIAVQQNALKVDGGIVGYYDNGVAVGGAQIDALKLAEGRYIDNSKLSSSSKFVVDANGNNSTRNSFANDVAGVDMELYTAYIVTNSTAGRKVSFTLNDTNKTAFTTGYLVADGQQIVVNFAVDTVAKDYTINNRLVRVGTTDAVKEIVTVDGAVTVKDVADYQTAAELQTAVDGKLSAYTEGTEKPVTNAKITRKGNTLNVVIDKGKTAGEVTGTGLLAGAAALINDGNTVTLTFANGEKMVIDAGAAANLAGLKTTLVGMIGHQAPTTAVMVTVTNTASGQSVNYTVNLSTASV